MYEIILSIDDTDRILAVERNYRVAAALAKVHAINHKHYITLRRIPKDKPPKTKALVPVTK